MATSILTRLRDLVPIRPLSREESLRVAELQARRLLDYRQVTAPPVPESVITTLPNIHVIRLSPLPVSGSTHWAQGQWVITLNGAEAQVRQRFSLAHEFKHILDNPFDAMLYPNLPGENTDERAEKVCDYFAACLLMPRAWVRRAWHHGLQHLPQLARRFRVSQMAMHVRLLQTGLIDPPARCSHRTYQRALPISA
jgi:Zn-dependent peptidase ImmA (M78 family)